MTHKLLEVREMQYPNIWRWRISLQFVVKRSFQSVMFSVHSILHVVLYCRAPAVWMIHFT
jgi:hypothetical protein